MRQTAVAPAREQIKWVRSVAAFSVVGLLALLAPVFWSALRAGASLFMLGALALTAWTTVQALPYLGQRLEKRLLRARLRDAERHPIEELYCELSRRTAQLGRYRNALASILAQIESMRELLARRRAKEPGHDTNKQANALQKMQQFHAHHLKNLAAAETALHDYERHLSAKRFEWEFARAGQKVLDELQGHERDSIVHELLSDEASRSVQASFNRVFASVELELHKLEAAPVLAQELS
jgi:hypothetical protein